MFSGQFLDALVGKLTYIGRYYEYWITKVRIGQQLILMQGATQSRIIKTDPVIGMSMTQVARGGKATINGQVCVGFCCLGVLMAAYIESRVDNNSHSLLRRTRQASFNLRIIVVYAGLGSSSSYVFVRKRAPFLTCKQ